MTVNELIKVLSELPAEVRELPVAVRDSDGEYDFEIMPCRTQVLRSWCHSAPEGDSLHIDIFTI